MAGRKSISIDVKKDIILLYDMTLSQREISSRLIIFHHCIGQTIRKFKQFHISATKPRAGRLGKVTSCENKTSTASG